MSALTFDLKQLVRAVSRQPGFFLVASLTLAIGCAAHLSAFTLLDRILLAPPPHVANAGSVFRLHIDRADPTGAGRFVWYQTPYPAYRDLQQVETFSATAGYRPTVASVGAGADARQITMVYADTDYFALLGATAQVGRVFAAEENQPPSGRPVVVLAEAYWRTAYAADPSIIGQSTKINATTYTIIGVMPRGFTGDTAERIDAWAPLFAGAHELPMDWTTAPMMRAVSVLVRLAPGVTTSKATEQAGALYRRTVEGTAAADPTAVVLLAGLQPGRTVRGELNEAGTIAIWIQVVAALVLLVAVANVINLQMSRGAQMRRDLAVRIALGAGRARLVNMLLLEMLLITATATVAALLISWWTAASLQLLLLPTAGGAFDFSRVSRMAALTMTVATLVCLTVSSLQMRVSGVGERLKSGRGGDGFSRARLRQGLLVAQVVVSVLLLVGAGLFLRSTAELGRLHFGHDHDRVLVISLPLRGAGYAPAAIEAFYERALQALPAVRGVERAAAAQTTPFAPSQSADIHLPGTDRLPLDARQYPTFYTVTPDFFATMGMSILRGRAFTDGDRTGAPPVMILEDALARALFPDEDALGKCVIVGQPSDPCRTVVGISSNTRRFVTRADGALRYYLPMAQRVYAATPQAIFVRTAGAPAAAMGSLRERLLAIDSNLPSIRMRTLAEMSDPEKRPWLLGSTLFTLFGAAALLVATTGVSALLSFMVAQRSREIGVRLALGASPGQTLRLILRQSLTWVTTGLIAGVAIALVAGRFIRPMLFETSPYDPVVFVLAAGVLLTVSLGASLAPAIRASRVDPNIALRAE